MWYRCYCLFATVNYLTRSWLVSQPSRRIQQSCHEAALTHSPKCTLREPLQEALLMVREEEAQSPNSNQGVRENRDQTVTRVKRFQERDSFLPSARIWKKPPTPNHRTSTASCHDSNFLPLRNPNTCPENTSRIWLIAVLGHLWKTGALPCASISG